MVKDYNKYQKERRAQFKDNGICVSCQKQPTEPEHACCDSCRQERRLRGIGLSTRDTRNLYIQMYEAQSGKCAICKEWYKVLCIDHCHKDNYIRALLCNHCNVGLGMFHDNSAYLTSAIGYLEAQSNKSDKITCGTRIYDIKLPGRPRKNPVKVKPNPRFVGQGI